MVSCYRIRSLLAVACGFFILTVCSEAWAAAANAQAVSALGLRFAGQSDQAASAKAPQPKPYTLPPDKEARAIAYAHFRHELYLLDLLFTTIGLLLLIQVRVAPKLRNWAEETSRNRFLQAVIFAVPFFILLGLLSLPG